jgi:signal transduction histidine kinase
MYRLIFKIIITFFLLFTFVPGGLAQEKKIRTCVMFLSNPTYMVACHNMSDVFNESLIQPSGGLLIIPVGPGIFFSDYKWYILGIIVFAVMQLFVIIYYVKARRLQKKVRQQMQENQEMLNKIVRKDSLSKMAVLTASLSHELNQPLTAILSYAQAGMRFLESDKLDRKQAKEIFENIIEDDKRAAGIIGSVRSLMKLEIREKERVMVNSLIDETIDVMRYEIIGHGVKLITKLENSPIFVFAYKIQLQQVLLNFLRNSIDAMEKSNTGDKEIEITMRLSMNSVYISVRDTGPGIDKNIADKIFKPFVTTNRAGFGIGLALSRAIIENHNGEIWARNIPGGGAEFSFRLTAFEKGLESC